MNQIGMKQMSFFSEDRHIQNFRLNLNHNIIQSMIGFLKIIMNSDQVVTLKKIRKSHNK